MNDKFASLSEALYIAERQAREEIRLRNEVKKQKKIREEELREQQLRQLAAQARAERSARAHCVGAAACRAVACDACSCMCSLWGLYAPVIESVSVSSLRLELGGRDPTAGISGFRV